MVPRFALMPDSEDLDARLAGCHSIQRDVPGTAVRDHELAQAPPYRPADVRMTLEYRHGVHDHRRGRDCSVRVLRSEEVEQPIEVGQGPRAVRDGGQSRERRR
jgi:hypothetical protein